MLKNGNTAGVDRIASEMLKCVGTLLLLMRFYMKRDSADLGDLFSEVGDIQPALPPKQSRSTPTPSQGQSSIAIPRPPSRRSDWKDNDKLYLHKDFVVLQQAGSHVNQHEMIWILVGSQMRKMH
uniref:Uncharacterized protein n=2 Tax=Timema TaxID=61471 RepID=A0A7R9I9U6_9NEOP|nr:unnamed protein product [Timema bartmani]CAD7453200.1 unnamed protein product [Timema tahoe]